MTRAIGLARLNALPPATAEAALCEVCGAAAWARAVAGQRPFGDAAAVTDAAEAAWDALPRAAWREAFAAHPRLGEDRRVAGGEASDWSRAEQSGMTAAAAEDRDALATAQREYEARFGWPYIVRATGRTAAEMAADCRARLAHDPDAEIAVAAREERRIGRLRLAKLLEPGGES